MANLRITRRALTRSPWFTAMAVLTIALGVGTNTAIFSIVNRVLFRPLPFHDPDRLVWISTWHPERGRYSKSSGWDYDVWKKRTATFEAVEAFWDRGVTLTGTEHPETLIGWQFTPNLFSMLGATAVLGRTFVPREGEPGRDNVVILSDALWRRRFNAAPDVVGSAIQLDGRSYTVVGVMPPTFTHPFPGTQLWTPLAASTALLQDRKLHALRVVARLREGVTRERAEAELVAIGQQLARDFPDTHAGWTVSVRPIRDFYIGNVTGLLWVLQATAFILLLIAAANVASLLLVRASGRQRETAVRVALGATRMDLFWQHLAEGLGLAIAGAAGGLLVAFWGTQLVTQLLATRLPDILLPDTAAGWIDARVVAAIAGVSVAIGVVFGITPLLKRPAALAGSLQGSRGTTADRRTNLLRNAIVASQIALSVALLVGAGLLVRSFARLQSRSFGFRTDGVVTAQLQLPRDRYRTTEQSAAFLSQLVAGVAALPGVEAAAMVNTLPLTGSNALRPHSLPGEPLQERVAEFRIVTPDYFRAMDIPLRRGRAFDDRDRLGSVEVIIVNETAAHRLWPGLDPVGQALLVPDGLTPSPKVVVGVVGDTRHHDLARDPEPEIYRPAYQAYWPFFGLVVRTQAPPELLERPLRDLAADLDGSVPIGAVQAFSALADTTWAWRRSSMALLSVFAGAALLLAFVGVYGVMAYNVAQRSREIGIRMALGARPTDVARAVLTQGALVTAVGASAGLALSAALAGLLGALLFGVRPLDLVTFAAVSVVTAGAGMLASALPALAAARVDPTLALNTE